MKIQKLSQETYQKIAAGEVIDRPVAVVRELLDNAIDSEASQIKLHIVEGGKKLIQISDNGFGMSKEDLKICYHKYTTSKIKNFEDIYQTISLGFRGEALNAISLVSEMEITSKTEGELTGYSIVVKNGELVEEKEVARNAGTTIRVQNLFYNIPVRQKFLKSDLSEFKQIKDNFIQKSIPFYDREFHLIHNAKTVFESLKSSNPIDRIALYLGKDLADHLIEVKHSFGEFDIHGFLSEPNFFKGSKQYQISYINQRPIFSPVISSAIALGYKDICPVGQFPIAILFLQLPPFYVDVNIHPTKREVKLLKESNIHQGIYQLIQETIKQSSSLPKIEFQDRVKDSISGYYQKNRFQQQESFGFSKKTFDDSKRFSHSSNSLIIEQKENHDLEKSEEYRIIGTLFQSYVLIEHENELILLDQHAAHERLEYEKLKAQISDEAIPSQNLLTPITLKVPFSNIETILCQVDKFLQLGFEVDAFGEDSLIIRTVPFFLAIDRSKNVVEKILEDLSNEKGLPSVLSFVDNMIKMKACRNAIKSGDTQTKMELDHLIQELLSYPNPFSCPHGRPTALHLDRSELEQLFLRKK